MKDKEFNLLDESWIKVIDEKCSVHELSLIELFEQAHTYKDLCGELPTQDFAMLRLLLAVLHTVFSRYDVDGSESPLDNPDDALDRWQTLWENKRFPVAVITKYLESQRENFYLFHPERPFYQVSELSKLGKIPNGEYDAQKLNGELAKSKNKARLFVSVNGVEKQSLSYSQAARWLLHVNAFDDNALKAGTGIGWLGQLGLIALAGNNLFETLMLNYIAYNINSEDVWEKERPIWENKERMTTQKRHIEFPNNYSELYTLQSRRILLTRSDERVLGYKVLGGDYFDKETSEYEPMTIWKRQVKGGNIPKEHNSSIQFWRDFASIIYYTNIKNGNGDRNPGVILWFKLLLSPDDDLRIIPGDYFVKVKIASVKYCGSQRSSIENVFADSIQLHAALISDINVRWRTVVLNSIQFCDDISKKVWSLARDINLACGGSNRTKESKGTAEFFAERAKTDFYNRIDGSFRRWLCTLNPETDNAMEKEIEWRKKCVGIARQLGNEIISQTGTEAIFGRTSKSSEEKDKKKNKPLSAASAMNRFLSGLSAAEKQ
ncbi:MAG: type I-E CRISPR-associated protein Cse1/CasA [Blautia sp.]|nr:type I-E CRISPR-associated protein Cse1/CasA [Blautia sp.]